MNTKRSLTERSLVENRGSTAPFGPHPVGRVRTAATNWGALDARRLRTAEEKRAPFRRGTINRCPRTERVHAFAGAVRFALPTVLLILSGCFGLKPLEHELFRIPSPSVADSAPSQPTPTGEKLPALLLRNTTSENSLYSRHIMFTRDPFDIGYYQHASWIDSPPDRLVSLLRDELERRGNFASVATAQSSALAPLLLNVDLRDFRHDIAHDPGDGVCTFRLELVNGRTRQIFRSVEISSRKPASEYDVRGGVNALSEAAGSCIMKAADWVATQAESSELRKEIDRGKDLPLQPALSEPAPTQGRPEEIE